MNVAKAEKIFLAFDNTLKWKVNAVFDSEVLLPKDTQ